jgi:hypothetical protein
MHYTAVWTAEKSPLFRGGAARDSPAEEGLVVGSLCVANSAQEWSCLTAFMPTNFSRENKESGPGTLRLL